MIGVHVLVEGQTEESFINNILAPAFWHRGTYLTARLLGVPGHKGGGTSYARVKRDVRLLLKEDPQSHCSTMIDLYGLGRGFPGTPLPQALSGSEKAVLIEEAFKADIANTRLIPYISVHEYEGLLFSDPTAFAGGVHQPHLADRFRGVRNQFPTPEDINDDPNTAPSKRVVAIYPQYGKVIDGTLAAQAVGLNAMRRECPHFAQWVRQLESLGA